MKKKGQTRVLFSRVWPFIYIYFFGNKAGLSFSNCTRKHLISLVLIGCYEVFLFQNSPKNPDPSYKMDLDFCDCFGKKTKELLIGTSIFFPYREYTVT